MRYIKIQNSKFKIQNSRGFTLIELLIVIALLGALAIGLLATVDPFEQLKKGTDTSTRNTVSELYNSFIRYYSVKSAMPWNSAITLAASDTKMISSSGYIDKVVQAGELKPDFIQLAGGSLDTIYITSNPNDLGYFNNVAVCFSPNSKSFSNEPNSKYTSAGDPGTNCQGTGGTKQCYWCIK